MGLFTTSDIVAIVGFALTWAAYSIFFERSSYGRDSLNTYINRYREGWMQCMLHRDLRVVDVHILMTLLNSTAFFTSTTLIAIGGSLSMLRSTNEAVSVMTTLPLRLHLSTELWEVKTIGLIIIFVYAFFEFAWAYRLFNNVLVLFGATPVAAECDTPEAQKHIKRMTKLFQSAARHFNNGQQTFSFAFGYLGWFINPWALMVTTAAVVIVLWRRQFSSKARSSMDD